MIRRLINCLIVILLFVYCLLSLPIGISAAPSISIDETPTNAKIFELFVVAFTVVGGSPNTLYNYKGRIGKGDVLTLGQTYNEVTSTWYADNSSWDNMPVFSTDSEGKYSGKLIMRAKDTAQTGENNIKVRIEPDYDSNAVAINLLSADISPTSIPTNVLPSNTPTPKPLTSTPTPKLPTNTPTPYATFKIETVKGSDGVVFNSNDQVKVYVDDNYINGYAPREIKFCSGCKCNPNTSVNDYLCELGTHTIKLEKSGYNTWSEQKEFTSGTITANPVLSKSVDPTNTPTPTITSTPASTVTIIIKPTPTITPVPTQDDKDLLGIATESAGFVSDTLPTDEPLSPTVLSATDDAPFGIKKVVPYIIIGFGTVFLGASGFTFIKNKG